MRKINPLLLLTIFAIPICTATSVTYRIDITPVQDNEIYEMSVNDTVTFQVAGYQKNEETNIESSASIDKVWWNFDKEILTKVNSNASNSITLKAIKPGASKLTAIAMVKNHNCTETITILVKESEQKWQ